MRRPLTDFAGPVFDVVVIGGGINGTAVARELAFAGYAVALVEHSDFGSGASSRSSRFAHCGLNYLAPQTSILDHLLHPLRFAKNLRMARSMLSDRADLVAHHSRHVQRMRACLPIYADGPFASWQVRAAFALLTAPRSRHPLVNFRLLERDDAASHAFGPLVAGSRRLQGIAEFDEFQFVWPERLCIEAALEAERHGAFVRNYTGAYALRPLPSGGWQIDLVDSFSNQTDVTLQARFVINTAGPWADRLLSRIGIGALPKCLTLTKGVHVLVRLPPACRGHALVTLAADGHFFTAAPCGEFHYLGPTETPYDGDPSQARASEDDIAVLLGVAKDAMPGAQLRRAHVLAAWAGVRPVTRSDESATGRHEPAIHDLSDHGVRDMLTLSWGRLVDHRATARAIVARVAARLAPSQAAATQSAPAVTEPAASLDAEPRADRVERIAAHEHVVHLDDILFRRTSAGWDPALNEESMHNVARAAAGPLGWDTRRVEAELAGVRTYRREVLGTNVP